MVTHGGMIQLTIKLTIENNERCLEYWVSNRKGSGGAGELTGVYQGYLDKGQVLSFGQKMAQILRNQSAGSVV